MSVERCQGCGRNVDTDYDVEGWYDDHFQYFCERCAAKIEAQVMAVDDRMEGVNADH